MTDWRTEAIDAAGARAGIPGTASAHAGPTGRRIWEALRRPAGHQHRLALVAERAGVSAGTVRNYAREWAAAGYLAQYESGVARLDAGARPIPPDLHFDAGGKVIYVAYPDEPFTTTINRTRPGHPPDITRRLRDVPGAEGVIDAETAERLRVRGPVRDPDPDPAPPATLPAVREDTDLPALLDAGARALAQATTDIERLRVRDGARAYQEAAKVLKRTDVLVDASILVQTAERTIAAANPAPDARESGGRKGRAIAHPAADIDRGLVRRIRSAHAHVDDPLFRRLVAAARADGAPLTRQLVARAGRDARGAPSPKVVHYSGNVEWTTPPHILAAARRVMGAIDLDPASSEAAQAVVQAERYYTAHEDGLKRAWAGRVWLNPPYTPGLVQAFLARLVDHVRAGKVAQAVVLTNNSTDTAWWQEAASHALAVCLLAGRLRFLTPSGQPAGAAIQGQTVLYFAAEPDDGIERFAHWFRSHGTVFYPIRWEPEVEVMRLPGAPAGEGPGRAWLDRLESARLAGEAPGDASESDAYRAAAHDAIAEAAARDL